MELKDRVKTLVDSTLITRKDGNVLLKIVEIIYKKYDVILKEDNAAVLITHLFGVLSRTGNSITIDDVPEIVLKEIQSNSNYKLALDIVGTISENISLNEVEKNYVLLHLVNIISNPVKFREGLSLSHEHMTIDLSKAKNDQDAKLSCYEDCPEEIKLLAKKGIKNIIDMSNTGMGRNINNLKKLHELTGINFLASIGSYKDPFIPEFLEKKTIDELVNYYIDDYSSIIEQGIKVAGIGEIGTSNNEITKSEKKLFIAASKVSKLLNLPIVTHTTLGTMALEQIEIFKENEVDLSRVIISHVALANDLDYLKAILNQGVNIAFDTIGKVKYLPEQTRINFIKNLVDSGYVNQICLSLDITRKSHLSKNGGIGYNYIFEFKDLLEKAGVSEENTYRMLTNVTRIMEVKR